MFGDSRAMSAKDFARISDFVQNELGIMMPDSKKTLLESRIQKRLRVLDIGTFGDYCDYVFSPAGIDKELVNLMDLVTTNKTDFFREDDHFDFLVNTAVPQMINQHGAGIKRELMIWSAGCSTGEEPYTLAMVMSDFAEKYQSLGFKFSILATDISTKVLNIAQKGIYHKNRIEPVSMNLRKKYLLKSKDKSRELIRVNKRLRGLVKFRRLNFMDDDFGFREKVDILFCRNVVIYFDLDFQEKLFNKFYKQMTPGGYFFTGHSESLSGRNVTFAKAGNAVYQKPTD